jgi:competence protein ComGE
MLKKDKGFFLAELLLSLSIWMLMTASLLPIYIHVSKQSINTEKELEAVHLLHEVIQFYLLEGIWADREEVRQGFLFQISWQQVEENPVGVCVTYDDAFNQAAQKCENIES